MKQKYLKCEEALARQKLAEKRTPREQLARLDRGGFRALKERAKLQKRIEEFESSSLKKEK